MTAALPTIGVNCKDAFGYTALFWAVAKGRASMVAELLAAGADVNGPLCHGMSPVWRAASDSTSDVLRMLLAAGACLNERRPDGVTPLIALAKCVTTCNLCWQPCTTPPPIALTSADSFALFSYVSSWVVRGTVCCATWVRGWHHPP